MACRSMMIVVGETNLRLPPFALAATPAKSDATAEEVAAVRASMFTHTRVTDVVWHIDASPVMFMREATSWKGMPVEVVFDTEQLPLINGLLERQEAVTVEPVLVFDSPHAAPTASSPSQGEARATIRVISHAHSTSSSHTRRLDPATLDQLLVMHPTPRLVFEVHIWDPQPHPAHARTSKYRLFVRLVARERYTHTRTHTHARAETGEEEPGAAPQPVDAFSSAPPAGVTRIGGPTGAPVLVTRASAAFMIRTKVTGSMDAKWVTPLGRRVPAEVAREWYANLSRSEPKMAALANTLDDTEDEGGPSTRRRKAADESPRDSPDDSARRAALASSPPARVKNTVAALLQDQRSPNVVVPAVPGVPPLAGKRRAEDAFNGEGPPLGDSNAQRAPGASARAVPARPASAAPPASGVHLPTPAPTHHMSLAHHMVPAASYGMVQQPTGSGMQPAFHAVPSGIQALMSQASITMPGHSAPPGMPLAMHGMQSPVHTTSQGMGMVPPGGMQQQQTGVTALHWPQLEQITAALRGAMATATAVDQLREGLRAVMAAVYAIRDRMPADKRTEEQLDRAASALELVAAPAAATMAPPLGVATLPNISNGHAGSFGTHFLGHAAPLPMLSYSSMGAPLSSSQMMHAPPPMPAPPTHGSFAHNTMPGRYDSGPMVHGVASFPHDPSFNSYYGGPVPHN